MKMEKVDDCGTKSNCNLPNATAIGCEFVRQYYTKWSFHLDEVFQFYGNESVFFHDNNEVKGQEAIQKVIEKLKYDDCKARIHSVSGVYDANDSLVLQVCGELSINKTSPRRFVQHFVLCKQQAKKYYVQSDIFQWLDKLFCDSAAENGNKINAAHNVDCKSESVLEKKLEHVKQQNGHIQQAVSALNDCSLNKIIDNGNNSVPKERGTADLTSTIGANNGINSYSSPTKPQQVPKTTVPVSPYSTQQAAVPHQTLQQSLPDVLPQQPQQQQQSPPKQFSQQQQQPHHRSYGQPQRHSQRQPYGQQQQQPPYRHQPSQQQQPQQPLQQSVKRQDSHPKTWAKAVSNNSASIPSSQPSHPNHNYVNNNLGGAHSNNGASSFGNRSHYNHYHNPSYNYSQQSHQQPSQQTQQQQQQYRPPFGAGGGNHQRKQFQMKTHK